MSVEKDHKEPYTVIGEFVAKVNLIEFLVNTLLEKIIMQYHDVSDIQDAAENLIDHIEEESLKNRQLVSYIKQYAMKNNMNYIDLWIKLMYPINKIRNEFSLFDYIINNKDEWNNLQTTVNSIYPSTQVVDLGLNRVIIATA